MSYSSSVGRFLERDPIGYSEDGMNLYQAYRGNPINRADPLGLASDLPPEVKVPTSDSISGNVRNQIQDIIQTERQDLLRQLQNSPPDIIKEKLEELQNRQKEYKCAITIKSVDYIGTIERTSERSINQSTPGGGPPRTIRIRSTLTLDRFKVTAFLKCTCPIKEGDYTWEVLVRRGDVREHAPSQGPQPGDKPIHTPNPPIPVDFQKDVITVTP